MVIIWALPVCQITDILVWGRMLANWKVARNMSWLCVCMMAMGAQSGRFCINLLCQKCPAMMIHTILCVAGIACGLLHVISCAVGCCSALLQNATQYKILI